MNKLVLDQDRNKRAQHLRARVGELLFELDTMVNVNGPNLEAQYLKELGGLETQLLQVQIEHRRIKRAIQLCQAQRNRSQFEIDKHAIERQLDREFQQWADELRRRQERLSWSERRLQTLATPEASAAVRTLYRQLVKKLHPDLHPEQDEERQRLWFAVQEAYQRADWRRLESLLLSCADELPQSTDLERLEARCAELECELERLQKEFPFVYREQLQDPLWIEERKADLRHSLAREQLKVVQARAVLGEFF